LKARRAVNIAGSDERTAVTWWAIQLAKDLDACRDLLNGEPVDPARLDPKALARAKALRLVRLDFAAIDLFANIVATPVDQVEDDDWDAWFMSLPRTQAA
jgi:hypothetical protein